MCTIGDAYLAVNEPKTQHDDRAPLMQCQPWCVVWTMALKMIENLQLAGVGNHGLQDIAGARGSTKHRKYLKSGGSPLEALGVQA